MGKPRTHSAPQPRSPLPQMPVGYLHLVMAASCWILSNLQGLPPSIIWEGSTAYFDVPASVSRKNPTMPMEPRSPHDERPCMPHRHQPPTACCVLYGGARDRAQSGGVPSARILLTRSERQSDLFFSPEEPDTSSPLPPDSVSRADNPSNGPGPLRICERHRKRGGSLLHSRTS